MRRFLRSTLAMAPTEWGLVISVVALLLLTVFAIWRQEIVTLFTTLTHRITSW